MSNQRSLKLDHLDLTRHKLPVYQPGSQRPLLTLLYDLIVSESKEKFSEYPMLIALFEDITLDEFSVEFVFHAANGFRGGTVQCQSRDFHYQQLTWTARSIHSDNLFTLVNETLFTHETVPENIKEGVYRYTTATKDTEQYMIIVKPGTPPEDAPQVAKEVMLRNLLYTVPDKDIVIGDGYLTVKSHVICGEIDFLVGAKGMFVLPEGSIMG